MKWKEKNPTTANRLKRVFSHMFNMARAWGYTEMENQVTGIEGFALGKREVDEKCNNLVAGRKAPGAIKRDD